MFGKPCPIPVVEARKILTDENADGVKVIVDNTVAVSNLKKLGKSLGCNVDENKISETEIHVILLKNGVTNTDETETGKDVPGISPAVLLVGSDCFGNGSEELGRILLKGFIYAVSELEEPPSYILFINSGVFLTSAGANTIDDLKKLEEKGTCILTCGTCLNFYGLTEKLGIGSITDMYNIVEILNNAEKVINI